MDFVLGIIMACRSFKDSFRVGVSKKEKGLYKSFLEPCSANNIYTEQT